MTLNTIPRFTIVAVGPYNLVTGTISIWSDVRYNQAFQFGEAETST